MPERSGPPPLNFALRSVLEAAVESATRSGLLTVVQADLADRDGARPAATGRPARVVVPFPGPRRPWDDGPNAA